MRYDANWALAAHLLCLCATNTNHVFDRRGGFALDFARASTACASFVYRHCATHGSIINARLVVFPRLDTYREAFEAAMNGFLSTVW